MADTVDLFLIYVFDICVRYDAKLEFQHLFNAPCLLQLKGEY